MILPLDNFIDAFIYFERAEHAHTVDRFLLNGDTELQIDFYKTRQHVHWTSALRTAFMVLFGFAFVFPCLAQGMKISLKNNTKAEQETKVS